MKIFTAKKLRLPSFDLSSAQQLSPKQDLIRIIANRLFVFLITALVLMLGLYLLSSLIGKPSNVGTLPVVIFTGILGGLIGLQNRLNTLDDNDLLLLAKSNMYLMLAPVVGGFLATLLLILFISGLLEGDLFPAFTKIPNASANGIASLFYIQGENGYEDYGKLIFWCFVAGFSERFVTNIISRFENTSASGNGNSNPSLTQAIPNQEAPSQQTTQPPQVQPPQV